MEPKNKIDELEKDVNDISTYADGEEIDDNNTDTNNNDESGRPNRGTGSAGPKNPGGTGGKGQYSLKNPDEQDA